MGEPIYVSPEQQGIIEEVQDLDARFGADKTLFHSLTAINEAKALIDKALAAGLDQRVFHPLQIWVSLHNTDRVCLSICGAGSRALNPDRGGLVMKLRFVLSGSLVATSESDSVPQIGSDIVIRTEYYKKGVTPGSLLRFAVSSELPPVYDYTADPIEVSIDVNGYEVLEEGPPVA